MLTSVEQNELEKNNATTILEAAFAENWILVKALLDNGADINAVSTNDEYEGMSVLWLAIADAQLDLVNELINKGADINAVIKSGEYEGMSVLWIAVNNNHWRLAKDLINMGADIHAVAKCGEYEGMSILWLAVRWAQWDLVNDLLKKDADINSVVKNRVDKGANVLWVALRWGQWQLAKELIKKGADTDAFALGRGILVTANDLFTNICDDTNFFKYKANRIGPHEPINYTINVIDSLAKETMLPELVSTTLQKTNQYLHDIQDAVVCSIPERIKKINDFFLDNNDETLIIFCNNLTHLVPTKLIKKDGEIFLYIYNDGAGLPNHHTIFTNDGSQRFANSMAFKVPFASKNEIVTLLTKEMETAEFYFCALINDNLIPFQNTEIIFSKSQIGHTCSVKSVRAFLQNHLSKLEYLLFKFEIYVATFCQYYDFVKFINKYSENQVAEQIEVVHTNIIKLADKILNILSFESHDIKELRNYIISNRDKVNSLFPNAMNSPAVNGTSWISRKLVCQ